MAWSKIKHHSKKPLGWWICKMLCETGWVIRKVINSERVYYFWLNKMIDKYRINLYGKKIE